MSLLIDNPNKGSLLVAEPFLGDSNFDRTVVLLSEHNEQGAIGFVVNRPLEVKLNDIAIGFPELDTIIYHGGPVQEDSLFFVHNKGDLIPGSDHIMGDLYWGGELEALKELIRCGLVTRDNIRFYLGYSGWGMGQLSHEIDEKSWLIIGNSAINLFSDNPTEMWGKVLMAIGGNYPLWANSPADPNLN